MTTVCQSQSIEASPTDAELVSRAKAGQLTAFELLVSRHERQVHALAFRILRQEQDAQDITQTTFISAIEHLDSFREEASFLTWLTRIATNAALKIIRKRNGVEFVSLEQNTEPTEGLETIPHPEFIADWRESPELLVSRAETSALIEDALARLDEKHRLVFLLRDVQGLSIEETAKTLAITAANVKVRLLRARLHLREILTQSLGDPGRQVVRDHQH